MYLKNRYINESKSERLTHHVLETASILNKKGFLVAVDFEKAFDLIDSSFLPPVLQKYSFGESFLKWIQILIENQESYVVNGGITQHSLVLIEGCLKETQSLYFFLLVALERSFN